MIMDPCSCHIELRQATGNAITKLRENVPVILFTKLNEIVLGHFNLFLLVITKISHLRAGLCLDIDPGPNSDRRIGRMGWFGGSAGFVRCAAPVRRVRFAVPVRRCGQWVRLILFNISIGRVIIWREHVAGCSLPLNTESQAIASCLIPKMEQYAQYIYIVIDCNPVD